MSGTQPRPSIAPNPNVPDVSQPLADLTALTACMVQVRQGIRSLAGLTGPPPNRAVTFNDLTTLEARVAALEARITVLEAGEIGEPPGPGR
jgi:hypothetical protein